TQMEAIEARGKGKTVNVIVAKRELKRGDKISSDSVAVRPIPVDYAHSAAISPDSFDRIDGQPLAYPIKPGEMILWGLMEGKKVPTFSARVETGRRAMTVPVDEINSISGLLEPGDLIDLMVTIDQKGRKVTLPLLQSVQVMATGQQAVDGPREGERKQYSTVTIDTTPDQAKNVIIARDAGKITALLRNPDDKNRNGGNADMASLLGRNNTALVGERTIPVLYGGTKLDPDALVMGARPRPALEAPGQFPVTPPPQASTQQAASQQATSQQAAFARALSANLPSPAAPR
ncbi:MAG: Flp pilus assembly protein CpaB, partial [Herminiimonas sp.]|nr:Flp pilus assembly protein CpaB [Herminiimonas sp.]